MSKITAEMWEKARNKLSEVYRKHTYRKNYTDDFWLQGECCALIDRYDDGERSVELYNAIMELC